MDIAELRRHLGERHGFLPSRLIDDPLNEKWLSDAHERQHTDEVAKRLNHTHGMDDLRTAFKHVATLEHTADPVRMSNSQVALFCAVTYSHGTTAHWAKHADQMLAWLKNQQEEG